MFTLIWKNVSDTFPLQQMNRKLALIILGVLLLARNVVASDVCDDNESIRAQGNWSLDDLVENATFTGLYEVYDVDIDQGNRTSDGEELYSYSLVLREAIKGNANQRINVVGLKPYDQIPPHYLAAIELHENVPPARPTIYGTTSPVMQESTKECIFAPRMIVEYSYLIIGGTNSQISFEMIPVRHLDNWYRQVSAAAKKARSSN